MEATDPGPPYVYANGDTAKVGDLVAFDRAQLPGTHNWLAQLIALGPEPIAIYFYENSKTLKRPGVFHAAFEHCVRVDSLFKFVLEMAE